MHTYPYTHMYAHLYMTTQTYTYVHTEKVNTKARNVYLYRGNIPKLNYFVHYPFIWDLTKIFFAADNILRITTLQKGV